MELVFANPKLIFYIGLYLQGICTLQALTRAVREKIKYVLLWQFAMTPCVAMIPSRALVTCRSGRSSRCQVSMLTAG